MKDNYLKYTEKMIIPTKKELSRIVTEFHFFKEEYI